ncbi:MAG: hypothetical protein WC876_11595 [Candidatus Thermoplasmatota archaeon]|jgi:hypothetical protein
MNQRRPRPLQNNERPDGHLPRSLPRLAGALGLVGLMALTQVAAQNGCTQDGFNGQCTEFGSIAMEGQRDIRGDPIDVSVAITLNTAYEDQGARWLLFSARNVEQDGSNPVTLELTGFSSAYGDIVTTRVEHATANELDLWVDILDTPVGTPITLDLKVGATERGAFRLETLVMAFDRGYAPIQDSNGNDASLFSFSLLGVNKETPGVDADGGSLVDGKKLPALGLVPLAASLAVAVALLRRRVA